MADDSRDPTTCSLYYFALGKAKLVQGLWKQAAWHPEQKIMLKFLGNDFTKERWQTAALKNAFALLSKQRYSPSFSLSFHFPRADRSTSRLTTPSPVSPNTRLRCRLLPARRKPQRRR
jgi:hypothetical protein